MCPRRAASERGWPGNQLAVLIERLGQASKPPGRYDARVTPGTFRAMASDSAGSVPARHGAQAVTRSSHL
jgi:hypothetical protein